jgi:hypothetical protein
MKAHILANALIKFSVFFLSRPCPNDGGKKWKIITDLHARTCLQEKSVESGAGVAKGKTEKSALSK